MKPCQAAKFKKNESNRGQYDRIGKSASPEYPHCKQHRTGVKWYALMHYCDDLEASIKESRHQNELLLHQVLKEALEVT